MRSVISSTTPVSQHRERSVAVEQRVVEEILRVEIQERSQVPAAANASAARVPCHPPKARKLPDRSAASTTAPGLRQRRLGGAQERFVAEHLAVGRADDGLKRHPERLERALEASLRGRPCPSPLAGHGTRAARAASRLARPSPVRGVFARRNCVREIRRGDGASRDTSFTP